MKKTPPFPLRNVYYVICFVLMMCTLQVLLSERVDVGEQGFMVTLAVLVVTCYAGATFGAVITLAIGSRLNPKLNQALMIEMQIAQPTIWKNKLVTRTFYFFSKKV